VVWGKPYSLTIEPTNKCNLNCLECPSGNNSSTRPKGFIDINLYQKIIDEVKGFVFYHMIYLQGEPLLHPNLFEFIRYADQNKIYTCTSTNGHFLTEENCEKIIESGLKKLIISVDGVTQESYSKYRVGGDLEKVKQGIQTLAELKQKFSSRYPIISLQFLVFRHNEHEIDEFKKLAKQLGADQFSIKSAQIDSPEQNLYLIPSIDKYSRYSLRNNSLKIKNKLKNKCLRIWNTLVITWDGYVIPCCFDKSSEFSIGNLKTQSAISLWKSLPFKRFRKSILTNRKITSICRNCTEGLSIRN
jgi:radical SAM protein with 4Fe4S-binding SPASM domain